MAAENNMNSHLFDVGEPIEPNNAENGKKSSGPPNRMNDLVYRDWMKFQKSFFRFSGWQSFVDECVTFFTKERWPDGSTSDTLIVGHPKPSETAVRSRNVTVSDAGTLEAILRELRRHEAEAHRFDFVLVNFGSVITAATYDSSIHHAAEIFHLLRTLLQPSRYCGITCDWEPGEFPVPWALAKAGRRFIKLRDEKIALDDAARACRYCLFFQAEEDGLKADEWRSASIQVSKSDVDVAPLWVMPKSPPRKADEILHPAKFPERLVGDFIATFSHRGDTVLDPMMGTGSALIAAIHSGRSAVGVDLNSDFVEIAQKRIAAEPLPLLEKKPEVELIHGDARNIGTLLGHRKVDYCVTSPPYWSMLTNEGSENQQARRERNLPTVYSESNADLGNIAQYDEFLGVLVAVYSSVAHTLKVGGHLTVVVKNVKRNHVVYPLAWDLVARLASHGSPFDFVGNTLWCQDDVGLKPFAVGIYWVSNTLHTYCLHFRRR